MANNNQIAVLDSVRLVDLLGPRLSVMKSARENARYPYYLKTPIGPVHLNTPGAQEFILENAEFFGAGNQRPDPVPDPPAPAPAADENPEKPSNHAVSEPEAPAKKPGFLESFFTLDE